MLKRCPIFPKMRVKHNEREKQIVEFLEDYNLLFLIFDIVNHLFSLKLWSEFLRLKRWFIMSNLKNHHLSIKAYSLQEI